MEYLLNVHVHAVAGLKYGDNTTPPNPFVEVKAFDTPKSTVAAQATSSYKFDSFFSVNTKMSPSEFLASDVCITVYHSYMNGLRQDKVGSITFGLERIHSMAHHVLRKDWFPIAKEDSPANVLGFVQLTLGTYGPGDKVPRQAFRFADDDADGGEALPLKQRVVKLPEHAGKNLYELCFNVHQAQNLPLIAGTFRSSCDPYVEVVFNGVTLNSTVISNNPNPVWNEEIKVPFNYPAWDDSINVRVLSGSSELGKETFSAMQILSNMMPPTWFNFHHAPTITGLVSSTKCAKCDFGGRILFSAAIVRTERPLVGVSATRTPREPSVQRATLWLDFFEVCFDATAGAIETCFATVSMSPFVENLTTKEPRLVENATFVWDGGSAGRLEAVSLQLPAPEQCSDIIVSLHIVTSGLMNSTSKRYMYIRIPAKSVWDVPHSARWWEMFIVENEGEDANAGFLLASISIQSSSATTRPEHQKIAMEKYMFRALIHQAVNLPASDPIGTSDAFVVVFFGPAMVQTPIYGGSLCPTWHRFMEAEVTLPKKESMRPDIVIFILDKDDEDNTALSMVRYDTRQKGSLPVFWKGSPQWLKLQEAPGGPVNQGSLLCGFDLVPHAERHLYPRNSIEPESIECRVEMFIIGVRLQPRLKVQSPRIEVSFGRKDQNTGNAWFEPLRTRFTNIGQGGNGNFNFLEKLVLSPCPLAAEDVYQDYLEVRLIGGGGASGASVRDLQVMCSCSVHLTPYKPWIPKERQIKVKEQHRKKGIDEMMREEALEELLEERKGNAMLEKSGTLASMGTGSVEGASFASKLLRNGASADAYAEELSKALGWNYKSIEETNFRVIHQFEHACTTKESKLRYKEAMANLHQKQNDDENEAAKSANGKIFSEFKNTFQWAKLETVDKGYGKHFDLDEEMEESAKWSNMNLPYIVEDLYIAGDDGSAEVVGSLKYMVRVVEKSAYKDNGPDMQQQNKDFEKKIEMVHKTCVAANNIVVRLYILGAEGLAPASGNAKVATFLWSTCGDESDMTKYGLKDTLTVKEHTLFPDFNVVHSFKRCAFPENAVARVRVMERTSGFVQGESELIVGETMIDLEDRWFCSKWRACVKGGSTPIEARSLYGPQSSFIRGHLRLWVDVIRGADEPENPTFILPGCEPQPLEIRVVIWKLTDVVTLDGTPACAMVAARHIMDDGTVLEQETDQHNNTADGSGTFNWRMIFEVKVPCRDPTITFVAWDIGNFSSDAMSEVTLNFDRDFDQLLRTKAEVIIPRGKVYMHHVTTPGQVRAQLDLQVNMLSLRDAQTRKVGMGREEPNQDPWLNPEDPHLLSGREGILAQAAAIAGSAGSALLSAGKWALIMKILMMVGGFVGPLLGGLVFLLISKNT